MQKISFSLIALLLTLSLGASCFATTARQVSVEAEEYSIYSYLINQRFANQRVKTIVVLDSTLDLHADRMMQSHLSHIQQNARNVSQRMIAEFENKNQQAYSLSKQFTANGNVVLTSREQVRTFFKEGGGGWRAFYEEHPRPSGIISFSRVSFNSRRDEALVYVSWSCGGLCGQRGFLLLKKKNGNWIGQGVGVQVFN